MGGSTWSALEEEVFWTRIIPLSREAHDALAGIMTNPRTWRQLAEDMAEMMGPDARRPYTELGLCK